ncbi:succinate CoA transferase [Alicyclobacillus sp.]|uniref:succinate CoA transferase n=1 Tax=Alicyclobacillus sp. TaxID=61169 RepID=UPI0025B82591|nr:succinate CoA transferase [Alicyclobacillus sp.]MCL6516124.1 succinate CoA transferase [Alicyclobacillus sp.]
MLEERIRNAAVRARVTDADEVQAWIRDGMTVGVSGFTKSGDAKAVLKALVRRVERTGERLRIRLLSGASLGEVDGLLAAHDLVDLRSPYQGDATLRRIINGGEVGYIDQHLSEMAEWVRAGWWGEIDLAIIEAAAITEDGGIIPTTSVGNSPVFVERAKRVIVEINPDIPAEFEGLHDIYLPEQRPNRGPIPLVDVGDRIGTPYIPCPPEKIAAVVVSQERDTPSNLTRPDEETEQMAGYILEFLQHEVRRGRLPAGFGPLQSGVGSVANAVLAGLKSAPVRDLEVYTEVMQDAVFELLDAGVVRAASSCSFTLSESMRQHVLANFRDYKDRVVLRPQEISNHPEVVRRLGVIAINAALEVDVYGNVNSTHVQGTHMMNGLGGSGDFARQAALSIFVTKSIAKEGRISCVVPFVAHVDHTEHDVDVLVTERGLVDLRGLPPRARAKAIVDHLAHPDYRDALRDYVRRASARGGNTPHLLEEAFGWHVRYRETGDMRPRVAMLAD